MNVWALALGSTLAVALAGLVGPVALSLGPRRLERIVFLLVALAVGAMLGGALLHLIPEAYEALGSGPKTGLLVLAGVVAFFVLEKFLHWQHLHGTPEAIEGAAGQPHGHHHGHSHGVGEPMAALSLIGSAAHHLLDGAMIGGAYALSVETGLVTTLAVVAHEVPQQIGHYGILVYAGLERGRAVALTLATGLAGLVGAAAVLGVAASDPAAGQALAQTLLPVTAGMFLYVAGSDLIPELNRSHSHTASKSAGQLAMILLGVAMMAALLEFGH